MNGHTQTPDVFGPVLARLDADVISHFGLGPLRLVPAGCQDRLFSRLLRLAVLPHGDDKAVSHIFVKVFKTKVDVDVNAMRERVTRDYEATRRVYAAMLSHTDLGAVPPVACYPDLLAIVTEEVTGPTLLDYLQAQAAWFPHRKRLTQLTETMTTAGRWIREFQSTESSGRHVTIDHLRSYIDQRLQRLVQHAGARFTEHHRGQVLRHIDQLGDTIAVEELREVAVHSDLAPGNIIVSGHRIVVLDFAMAKLGTNLHDLTRLFVQIELLAGKPHLRRPTLRRLQQALVQGFDASLTIDRPLFRLLILLHRVNHLTKLSAKRAPWPEALYNRILRHQHLRWIAQEVNRGSTIEERS